MLTLESNVAHLCVFHTQINFAQGVICRAVAQYSILCNRSTDNYIYNIIYYNII